MVVSSCFDGDADRALIVTQRADELIELIEVEHTHSTAPLFVRRLDQHLVTFRRNINRCENGTDAVI